MYIIKREQIDEKLLELNFDTNDSKMNKIEAI